MNQGSLKRKVENENETRQQLKFDTCPSCGTGDLIEFGVDTICCHCEWNSAELYVKEGLMDNRYLAFREQFDPKNKIVRKYDQKLIHLKNHLDKTTTSTPVPKTEEISHGGFLKRAEGLL